MLNKKQRPITEVSLSPVVAIIIGSGNVPALGQFGADVAYIAVDVGA